MRKIKQLNESEVIPAICDGLKVVRVNLDKIGAYETDTKLWGYYGRAIEEYPNVLYTHTADMIASKIKGI